MEMPPDLPFVPQRAFVQEEALMYPLGAQLAARLGQLGVATEILRPRGRVPRAIFAGPPGAAYGAAKRTLVVAVRRTDKFLGCRPSADYQLPLVTSCPATCAYCYLQTTLSAHPYIRVYANLEQLLEQVREYAAHRQPGQAATSFEAAATGDPLAVEPLTGSLARAIALASRDAGILLRSVSKFGLPGSLVKLKHAGRTRLRWSVNTPEVVARWEAGTAPLERRVSAVVQAAAAGYPVGFMVAPVFTAWGWEREYEALLGRLAGDTRGVAFPRGADGKQLTFEVVTHRFTSRAKQLILKRHAGAGLPLEEEGRRFRTGQFGYGKFVYPQQTMDRVKAVFAEAVGRHFPDAALEYVV